MLNILNEKFDLSRRLVVSYVKPLSFREFLELYADIKLPKLTFEEILKNHNEISSSFVLENPTLYKHFLKYLQIGYYPFFKEDEEEYKNKLFNACDKIINEDIPSLNKIDYVHLSIFKKLIAKMVYAKVPFEVNISSLSKEFGISHPTMQVYLEILHSSNLIKAIKKYSKKISKKPNKLLFGNTNLLYTYSDEFGMEIDVGNVRETFFASCFKNIYYSDIGDFRVDEYIFEIGGKNKTFKQIKDVKNSYLVIDTDYSMEKNKIPLWLFGFLY
jgi:predicted AAA+ superfamily ATPase